MHPCIPCADRYCDGHELKQGKIEIDKGLIVGRAYMCVRRMKCQSRKHCSLRNNNNNGIIA